MLPLVLAVSGSDGSGGAGIQADLKSIQLNGGYGLSALTAITAQNTVGVTRVQPIDSQLLIDQLDAVFEDFNVDAIKVGMLPNVELLNSLVQRLRHYRTKCPIVVDPVMNATSGDSLAGEEVALVMKEQLLPLSTLVTPNIDEAQDLVGCKITDLETAKEAAKSLALECGCSVLLKGGHLAGSIGTDVLNADGDIKIFNPSDIHETSVHGTGCMLASAVATHLAQGRSMAKSVQLARSFINQAIASGRQLGQGQRLATLRTV